ncbi:MAG: S8 family peptidase [Limisphaerales bacterium]
MRTSLRFLLFLLVAATCFAAVGRLNAAAPEFTVTGIKIIAPDGSQTNAVAGAPFFVQVDYDYDNPVKTDYTIERVVNGWTNISAPTNYGAGYTGNTAWALNAGYWLIYKAGTYSITVTVDPANAVTPASNTKKSMTTNFVVGGSIIPQWALVNVEFGRTNLGPGTDVIVGTMDDAFDFNDPWYTGVDSLGRPRLVAARQNALGVNGGPTNDVHSTACLGIVVARGANGGDMTGLAPDARYVCAEFINRANLPGLTEPDVLDALNFLMTNGAEVINMPWSWTEGGTLTMSESGDVPITDLMADYLMFASNIFVVAYDNELTDPTIPTAPGAARNVITVGGLASDMVHVWSSDDSGPTIDGRCKPDILGGIAINCVTPSSGWRSGFPVAYGYEGNSFAGPFITGAAAEMIGYAKQHGLNRDHRLLKAILMNSGVTCLDDNGAPWTSSPAVPMDYQQGTGILSLQRVYAMYSAGQQPSGAVAVPGYDFATVYGTNVTGVTLGSSNGVVSYLLGSPAAPGADLDVTLAWDRHTYWTDVNGDGQIDAGDTFYVNTSSDAQSILHLVLYYNGTAMAQSISAIDTIQHLHLTNLTAGVYQLNVERQYVPTAGKSEPYGLAWDSSVPWTNVPPSVSLTGSSLGPGNAANLQFRLTGGQAADFAVQSTPSLAPPIVWTTANNAVWTQTGVNLFQAQVPFETGAAGFFRIAAIK